MPDRSQADLAAVLALAKQRRAEATGQLIVSIGAFTNLPTRLCRALVQAWLCRLERRMENAVGSLDRAGLLEGSPRGRHFN
jgi:hypothetical protein